MIILLVVAWVSLIFWLGARLDRWLVGAETDQTAFGLGLLVLVLGEVGAMLLRAIGQPVDWALAYMVGTGLAFAAVWGLRIQRVRAHQRARG